MRAAGLLRENAPILRHMRIASTHHCDTIRQAEVQESTRGEGWWTALQGVETQMDGLAVLPPPPISGGEHGPISELMATARP